MSETSSIFIVVFSILAAIGCITVGIGVILEGVEHLVAWGKKRSFRKSVELKCGGKQSRRDVVSFVKWANPKVLIIETFGFGILVVGLAIEFIGTEGVDWQQSKANAVLYASAASATNMAAQAIEKASKFDLARAVAEQQTAIVQSNNLELQKQLQPRTISAEKIKEFILLTKNFPKFPIRVAIGEYRSETYNFAYQIRIMLNAAGYSVPDSDTNLALGIYNDPTAIIFAEHPGNTDGWPDIQFISDMTNDFKIFHYASIVRTNGLDIITPMKNTNDIYGAFINSFLQIGVPMTAGCKPDWVSPNHCEIFVLERMH